jgi:hypothetical protein
MIIGRTSPNAVYLGQFSGESRSPGLVLTSDSEILPGYGEIPTTFPPSNSLPVAAVGRELSCSPAAQAHTVLSQQPGSITSQKDGPQWAYTYPDTASIKIRRENEFLKPCDKADFVPRVAAMYPLMEVGTGSVKDKFCGTYRMQAGSVVGACRNKPGVHKPKMIPMGCSRRECPEDWPKWDKRAAIRISGLVNGYLNQKYKNQKHLLPGAPGLYLPDHVILSPGRKTIEALVLETERALYRPDRVVIDSQDFYREFWRRYRKHEVAVIDLIGIGGCIPIPHEIRLRSGVKAGEKADREHDVNRYREVLDRADWRDHVKFSPHSHLITDGSYITMTSDELYEKTGWAYRNLGEVYNCEGLVYYLMSHAPAVPGMHNDRALGSFHPSRLAVSGEIRIPVYPKCQACIDDGLPEDECYHVVALIESAEYGRNERGRKELKTWGFQMISQKPYRRTARIKVYRILLPGEKINRAVDPKWQQYYSLEDWAALPPDKKPRRFV